ncbi:MAG TPA: BsuBI/PstI family type II restriction endonuclease [Candidatus Elarobacter sp.]
MIFPDGTPNRRNALLRRTDAAGLRSSRVAFLTAYEDRGSDAFRRTISAVVWGSFVWFASEPDKLLVLAECRDVPALEDLIR